MFLCEVRIHANDNCRHQGQKVLVTAQAGRKKVTQRQGILSETYPAIFIVKLNKREGSFDRVSYSYADLLTNNISLTFEEAE